MHELFSKEIMPDARLTCYKTDKFKSSCLSINFITQLDRQNASKNALLPKVLRRGTSKHPDMVSLAAALDDLYGARIEPVIRKKGELQCVGFYADFIDDVFLPGDEKVLEKCAMLLSEILLSPMTVGGRLNSDYVENEKSSLIDEIEAAVNDKRRYSIDRMLEHMCKNENYGTNKLGSVSAVKNITAGALTRHYRELIGSSRMEIFYCGASGPDRVAAAVREAFSDLPRAETSMPGTVVKISADQVREIAEPFAITQGKLSMGFRMGERMNSPNYPALMVFNAVFGGSVTSKLFLNVREKLSLCYYASSQVEKHKGIMIVSSGVDFDKYDAAKNEILAQLDAVRAGDISDFELTSAKRAVITSIKSAMDSQSGLESLYLDQAVTNIEGCTPDELASLADLVTADEIQKIAQSVQLDTVYFMKGEEETDGD
jgi:predicted Zn-dependent peptidase